MKIERTIWGFEFLEKFTGPQVVLANAKTVLEQVLPAIVNEVTVRTWAQFAKRRRGVSFVRSGSKLFAVVGDAVIHIPLQPNKDLEAQLDRVKLPMASGELLQQTLELLQVGDALDRAADEESCAEDEESSRGFRWLEPVIDEDPFDDFYGSPGDN
jgi:hypothetical protein